MATHWTLGGDASNPHRLAAFWALALGYVAEPGYDEEDGASIVDPDDALPAIGFLRAPVGYEVVRSLYQRFRSFDASAVNALLAEMSAEARGVVAQGSFGAPLAERRIAYMRYVGQGHEIAVELPVKALAAEDVEAVRAAYDVAYAGFYDRPVPGSDVEILSFAVTVATEVEAPPPVAEVSEAPAPAPVWHQAVRDTARGNVSDWPVYDRDSFAPGAVVAGPCIVAEAETSTLVGPGWTCRMDGLGYLELTR